ncbi:MAG: hypothetical protein AAGG57_08285 [Pseudomonadota bacterium]
MIDRIAERFDMTPDKRVGETGHLSAQMLGWLVEERGITPHIPVWDKSKRTDGTFSRENFIYDPATDIATHAQVAKNCGPIAGTSPSRGR